MIWLVLIIISLLSLVIIGLFYIRYLFTELYSYGETIQYLKISLKDFETHIKSIYELEMFYGEQTLEGLLKHARKICEDIQEFEFIFASEEEMEENLSGEEESEEEEV
jgi:hypothetical protein